MGNSFSKSFLKLLYILMFPIGLNAQVNRVGLQINIGAGYTNFKYLNQNLRSINVRTLEEFNTDAEINGILEYGRFIFRAGYAQKTFSGTENEYPTQAISYNMVQFHISSLIRVIEIRRLKGLAGFGICSSSSTFNFFSLQSTQNNFIVNNPNQYFTMYKKSSPAIKIDLGLYYKLYNPKDGRGEISIGVNSGYIFAVSENNWESQGGYPVNNVPKITENNFYFDLSVIFMGTIAPAHGFK